MGILVGTSVGSHDGVILGNSVGISLYSQL